MPELTVTRPGTLLGPSIPSADGHPAVFLDGVAQRLGGVWALRGVSLSVAPGELLAITGHNGSGKTTLLRVIATLLRPTAGTGSVYGHDLVRDADVVRELTALLTHATGLYDDLTAAENLEFALRMRGEAVDRPGIEGALKRFGLGDATGTRVRSFSSGMRRRAALARLSLHPARLLLLDEPYNSLDTQGVGLVDELLESTRARGGSAIVVMHDLERGSAGFDRIVELSRGRVADERAGATRRLAVTAGAIR